MGPDIGIDMGTWWNAMADPAVVLDKDNVVVAVNAAFKTRLSKDVNVGR